MLPAGLVKSKVMLCRLIFKAITGFFTLLSPCIFNNLLSNDLSPPYPPHPTPPHPSPPLPTPPPPHRLCLSLCLFGTSGQMPRCQPPPPIPYPPTSRRLFPAAPHPSGDARNKKKPCTHTCAPALASSRVNCINTRVRALATLFTVLPQTFSHSPLHFRRKTLGSGEGRQRWGNAEVGLSLLSSPLRSPLVSRGSYL